MSRYDQKVSAKHPSLMMICIFIVISIILVTWLVLRNNQDNSKINKPITIPIKKHVSDLEADTQAINDKAVSDLIADKQTGVNTSKEEIVNKPELMELEESDESFRDGIQKVSENLINWLNFKEIIKKSIIIINDLSQNQMIYKHRKFLKMPQKMLVKSDAQGLYISKQSYNRFDPLTNAITAIDVQKGLDLYLFYRPLLKQVFDKFSYPAEYQLEDIFLKAAASIIEAPVIERRLYLVRDPVRYEFADKKLQSLDDVKKQMLRMGPENTIKIQDKLRKLVESLVQVKDKLVLKHE